MARALSFIGLLVVAAVGMYLYSKQATSLAPGTTGSPKTTVNLVALKQDLLLFATAEKQHMATDGRYFTIAEMRAAGDTGVPADSRGPYVYSIETSGDSFTVTATCKEAPPEGAPRVIKLDSAGNMSEEP